MREAFTYMFKDPGYDKKAIIYFIICFCSMALMMSPELANIGAPNFAEAAKAAKPSNPVFVFLPLIGNFFSLLLAGYHLNCVEAITKQERNIVLPLFNLGTAFVRGFKNIIASLLMTLVLVLLFIPFIIGGKVTIIVGTVLLLLFTLYFFNALMWIFANEGKLTSYLAWKKAVKLVAQNGGTYFVNWLVLILLTIFGGILSSLLMLLFNFLLGNAYTAWLATSIESAVIASYVAFVGMYLVAKSIRPNSVV